MTRRWWGLLLLGVVILATPSSVSAHALLERAEPAPGSAVDQAPAELRISFTEPLDPGFSRVQVLDAQREVVYALDAGQSMPDERSVLLRLNNGLPNGVYTITWRTLSLVDGHTANGSYPLVVGPIPEGVSLSVASTSEARFAPSTAVARWFFFVAASGVFGTLLAWLFVFQPLIGRTIRGLRQSAATEARRLALACALLLAVATIYGGLAQAAQAADVPMWEAVGRPLFDVLGRGRYAALWWLRMVMVLAALALVGWRGVGGWSGQAALVAVAAALLTSSLNSHSAALLSGAYLGIIVDWVHFLAAAAWVGGLASLVLVLPAAIRGTASGADRLLAQFVARFSNLALVSIGVIVATGTFQAWLQVGSWEGLVQTLYGLSLTAKIALLALALVLASFNLWVVKPRLAAMAGKGSAAVGALARRFALAVRAELVLAALALVAAAVLTGITPAREELARRTGVVLEAGPVDRRVDAQGLMARVQIAPASLGPNRFAVELAGTDPNQVERVQFTLTYLDAELGSQPLVLAPSASDPSTWEATSLLLSQAGTWQAELLVRRVAQDDARTAIRFLVAAPGAAAQPPPVAAGAYPLLPSPMISIAYLLLAAGVGVIGLSVWRVMRYGRRSRRALQSQAALLGAGLMVLAGGGYVYAQEQRNGVPLDVANIRNPVPPDERALASGQRIYTDYCEACHGETGRGDGPAGLRLVPRPADLRQHAVPGVHTDGALFYWVSYGFPGSAMPAFRDQLSEQERWEVINYIRSTFGTSATQP